jgi:methanogenic corrinoid protein MtbC1
VTKQRALVIGAVDKEKHRISAVWWLTSFEQDGWTVYYLGAAVPTKTFLAIAREIHANLVGLSSD